MYGGGDIPNARIIVRASLIPPAPLARPSATPLRPFPPSFLYFDIRNNKAMASGDEYWASIIAPSNPDSVEVIALSLARIRLALGPIVLVCSVFDIS